MINKPTSSLPELPSVPDTVSLVDFLFDEKYGRCPQAQSLDPYVCGITGSKVSAKRLSQRVDSLARAMAHDLGWCVNEGSEFDKVIGVYSLNHVRSY